MIVPSAGNALEIVNRYSPLVSIYANNAWFPYDDKLEIEVTHSLELNKNSWLIQFLARKNGAPQDSVPGLVTAVVNMPPDNSKTFEFVPVHVLSLEAGGFYEVKVFDTECFMEHEIHSVIPSFDCIIDTHSTPLSAKVIIKLFIQYKNDCGKIVARAEMPFHIGQIVLGINGLNWWPQNHKSLIY